LASLCRLIRGPRPARGPTRRPRRPPAHTRRRRRPPAHTRRPRYVAGSGSLRWMCVRWAHGSSCVDGRVAAQPNPSTTHTATATRTATSTRSNNASPSPSPSPPPSSWDWTTKNNTYGWGGGGYLCVCTHSRQQRRSVTHLTRVVLCPVCCVLRAACCVLRAAWPAMQGHAGGEPAARQLLLGLGVRGCGSGGERDRHPPRHAAAAVQAATAGLLQHPEHVQGWQRGRGPQVGAVRQGPVLRGLLPVHRREGQLFHLVHQAVPHHWVRAAPSPARPPPPKPTPTPLLL
jgi:hypothetical protein